VSGAGYDPKIIERFVDQLVRKADTVRVGCSVAGGIFGVFVGAVPMTPLRSVWGIPSGLGVATVIVGALLGTLVGYVVGEGRAFRYRVQAQNAIFQLEIERRVTSAVAKAVAQALPAQSAVPAQSAEPPQPAVTSPPLISLETPPVSQLLLRPPGAPTPPLSPASAEPLTPPLSPAAPEPSTPPLSPTAAEPPTPPLSPAANG
jgi:hypothetical protein